MSITATFRYEAVRYMPVHRAPYPFQIRATSEDDANLSPFLVIVELSVEEARDLHSSLGVLLNNIQEVSNV